MENVLKLKVFAVQFNGISKEAFFIALSIEEAFQDAKKFEINDAYIIAIGQIGQDCHIDLAREVERAEQFVSVPHEPSKTNEQ